jgi:ABC-type ATPase with predicted acetyltransferase domain
MEWRHPDSPRTKQFKQYQSASKVMITAFWECDSCGYDAERYDNQLATLISVF